MEDFVPCIHRVAHKTLQLRAELVRHPEVKRTEVKTEGFIGQFLHRADRVNAEVEGTWLIARGRAVADPVEPVCIVFTLDDFSTLFKGFHFFTCEGV
jgi:hypothetical protein